VTPENPGPGSPDSVPDLSDIDARRPASGGSSRARDGRGESSGRTPRHGSEPPPADADAASPGYGGAGYPTSALEGEGPHLLDYVRVLYRRRYVAMTAFILVVVLVTVYTFTRTPIYQASVQIEIDYESPKVVPFQQVTDSQFGGYDSQEYYQTQYKILQSRSLARRTLDAANLWISPLLARHAAAVKPGSAPVGRGFPGLSAVEGSPANGGSDPASPSSGAPSSFSLEPETPSQTPIINALLDNVTVSPVRNSRLVDLKYSSTDPQFAALVANAMARTYIEQSLEYKYLSSREASDWLGRQLTEQRKQVEASEQALQRYREQTDSVSLEDKQNITVQKLADLNAAVTRAKTERLQKEALYKQVTAIEHDRAALDTFPAVLANPFIQQLKGQAADLQRQRASLAEKYGEKHPEMIRLRSQIDETDAKIQGEIAKVVQSIRTEYETAQAQENSLVGALEQQKAEAMALSRKGIDYGVLQRDANTNHQMFDALLQRAKETGVSAELKSTNIRIVDAAAVPTSPVSPRKLLNLVLAVFGGGIFAVGLAFFFEYLDNRVKSPEEIKHYLGLPFLGLVPVLEGKESAEDALLHSDVPAPFAEAFRGIRTNVLFSSAEEGGRSVVVTSTGPGEGKTLVATNLSVALAQAGQRVLLVDADMRKPRVHEVFHEPKEPGLSNVLVGNAKASETVRPGSVPNLWLLLSGVAPPNPAELLASRRFKEFLATLEEHFDWVIIDSPPVMAVTDAAVIAHVAQGVIFVVRCEHANKHAASTALEQLESAQAKFLGGVLNGVDVKRNSYYYSHYYRKAYSSYYNAEPGSQKRA
jgi:succinoglycan biosynthesis transport protein ExoP